MKGPIFSATTPSIRLSLLAAALLAVTGCESSGTDTSVDAAIAEFYDPSDDELLELSNRSGPVDYGLTQAAQHTQARAAAASISDLAQFQGPANAHQVGAWSAAAEWPLSAIHAAVLPTGHVMTYGTDELGNRASGFIYDIWNPNLGLGPVSHTTLDNQTDTNTFCSAQGVLTSGQLLITGGDQNGTPGGRKNSGVFDSNLYNPLTETLSEADDMNFARWYPSLTGLPNGESLILGGRAKKPTAGASQGVTTPEIYNANSGTYRTLPGAQSDMFKTGWYYPRAFVGNRGKVFIPRNRSNEIWSINWRRQGSVKKELTLDNTRFSNAVPSAMFRPGQVLMLTSNNEAKVLDIRRRKPTLRNTAAPGGKRIFSDTTLLADGQVLLSGGSSVNQKLNTAHYKAKLWSPETEQWTDMASAEKARLYHSTALLLPNGAVLTAGGGPPGPVINMNAEVFYPPYLFKKDGSGALAQRPTVTAMPAIRYGRQAKIGVHSELDIASVAMVRTGSVTHSYDQSQRYVPLNFRQEGDQLLVQGPKNRTLAPPGQYMLFIIDEAGVPSHAEMFQPQ